jgi:3-deoxy-D-manno-octulosonate 8-phosphate phosphatase (KDO 8-P phosphatase)
MTHTSRTLAERCGAIALLVVDVDGVLTDGAIEYGTATAGLMELKRFHVRDGFALRTWERAGKRTGLITGRDSPIVAVRAREVGIGFVHQGAAEKMPAYRRLLAEAGVAPEAICYVGDDLPDLPPLRHCGLAVAVADACPEARAEAHYITRAPGGRGAVREVIELILRCQGHWQHLVDGLRSERMQDEG